MVFILVPKNSSIAAICQGFEFLTCHGTLQLRNLVKPCTGSSFEHLKLIKYFMNFSHQGFLTILALFFLGQKTLMGAELPLRQRVLFEADRILNLANVSYVYGGNKLGNKVSCDGCTDCLSNWNPVNNKRLEVCPECRKCSLDCSHFISLVFTEAGLRSPYLTTKTMRSESPQRLRKNYHWVDLGNRSQRALPGDVLVYPGHAVLVEKIHRPGIGDIIHATSGREVKGPGQGIQRQTLVSLQDYRGPLQRVMRHGSLLKELRRNLSPRYGIRRK